MRLGVEIPVTVSQLFDPKNILYTPEDSRLEPENDALVLDDFPFPGGVLSGSKR